MSSPSFLLKLLHYYLLLLIITPGTSHWVTFPSLRFSRSISRSLPKSPMKYVRGGMNEELELIDPKDISLLESITEEVKIDRLLNAAGRIPAIRNCVDNMLTISKAVAEDALLATAVLKKLSSLHVISKQNGSKFHQIEEERIVRDRRFVQLFEIIEVEIKSLTSKMIFELFEIFEIFKISPHSLLIALEHRSLEILEHSSSLQSDDVRNIVDPRYLLQGFSIGRKSCSFISENITNLCLKRLSIQTNENLITILSSDELINCAWAMKVSQYKNMEKKEKEEFNDLIKRLIDNALRKDIQLENNSFISSMCLSRLMTELYPFLRNELIDLIAHRQFIRLQKVFNLKTTSLELKSSSSSSSSVLLSSPLEHELKEVEIEKGEEEEEEAMIKIEPDWSEADESERHALVDLLWALAKGHHIPPTGLQELVLDRILPDIFPLKVINKSSNLICAMTSNRGYAQEMMKSDNDNHPSSSLGANQLAKLGWAWTTFAKNRGLKVMITEEDAESKQSMKSSVSMFDHFELQPGARKVEDDATRMVVLAMSKLGPAAGVGCEATHLVNLLWALQERATCDADGGDGLNNLKQGLGFEWAATLGRLTVALEASLGVLTTDQVVSVIHAYAALRLRPANLLSLAARRLLASCYIPSISSKPSSSEVKIKSGDFIDTMTPKEVAIVAVAFASMGHPAPALYSRLATLTTREASNFEPKDLSKAMWALARAGHDLGPFILETVSQVGGSAEEVVEEEILLPQVSEDSLRELSATDLSRLHWALSSMLLIPQPFNVQNPPTTSNEAEGVESSLTAFYAPYERLFGLIHRIIDLKLVSFSTSELVDTVWGLSKLRRRQQKLRIIGGDFLMDKIANTFSSAEWDMSVFTAHQLARLSWGFANWAGGDSLSAPPTDEDKTREVAPIVSRGISVSEIRTAAVLAIGIEASQRLQQVTSSRSDVYFCGAAQQWHEVYMAAWTRRK